MANLIKNGQILPIFGHFGGIFFFQPNLFSSHRSGIDTQLHGKQVRQAMVPRIYNLKSDSFFISELFT